MIKEFFIPFKGIPKKTIFHFSDTHLALYDHLSTSEEIGYAKERTERWLVNRKVFCDFYGEPYEDREDKSAEDHFTELVKASETGDALILAGDIFDFISPANVRFFDRAFSSFPSPLVAVCGNHEDADDIPDGCLLAKLKTPIRTVDLGDMVIAAVDDSKRHVADEAIAALRSLLAGNKPVLIVMHVPVMTEGNRTKLAKADDSDYYCLNYDGCPENNLVFIDLVREYRTNVVAVLAGHLHCFDESEIAPGVVQYVSSQGLAGNMNKYIIGE